MYIVQPSTGGYFNGRDVSFLKQCLHLNSFRTKLCRKNGKKHFFGFGVYFCEKLLFWTLEGPISIGNFITYKFSKAQKNDFSQTYSTKQQPKMHFLFIFPLQLFSVEGCTMKRLKVCYFLRFLQIFKSFWQIFSYNFLSEFMCRYCYNQIKSDFPSVKIVPGRSLFDKK